MALIPNARPSLTVGERVFTDITNLIVAYGRCSTTNTNSSLRKYDGTAGYQVTAGKSYEITAMSAVVITTSGAEELRLLYSDNDVGIAVATGFTTPIYPAGNSGTGTILSLAAAGNLTRALRFRVIAAKYPGITNSGTVAIVQAQTYGYEV